MIVGKERSRDGAADVVVEPDGGGQGQDALQDPDQDTGPGVAAVAFQVELNLSSGNADSTPVTPTGRHSPAGCC